MFRVAAGGLARAVAMGVAMVVSGFTLGARQARASMFESCEPGNAGTACWWSAVCSQKCVTYFCWMQTCDSVGAKVCVVCEDYT